MPKNLDPLSVIITTPDVAHAQLPEKDALASSCGGLESATTEWPDLEMWPCVTPAQDDAWDEVVAALPHGNALTRSAESAVAAGAPRRLTKIVVLSPRT